MAVAPQVRQDFGASQLPQLPELVCGGTLNVAYHGATHVYGPSCCIAEAPDCQSAPAPYRPGPAPERPSHSPRTSRGLEDHAKALAVGVAVCALGACVLLGLALARYV